MYAYTYISSSACLDICFAELTIAPPTQYTPAHHDLIPPSHHTTTHLTRMPTDISTMVDTSQLTATVTRRSHLQLL